MNSSESSRDSVGSPARNGEPIELVIDKVVHRGKGLGRTGSRVCFVSHVLPGERVSAIITRVRRDYLEATLQSVLLPAAERRSPPCKYFGRCGGCHLQHTSEKLQGQMKVSVLAETLRRAGSVDISTVEWYPIMTSSGEFGYRNRIQLKSRLTPEGRVFGLFAEQTHDLVPLDQCLLISDSMNVILAALPVLISKVARSDKTPSIELQESSPHGKILVVMTTRRPIPNEELAMLFGAFEKIHADVIGLINRSPGARRALGQESLEYRSNEMKFRISDRSFVQPNWDLTCLLIERALDWVGAPSVDNRNVIDLFSGVGTFSLPFARRGFYVTGLEGNTAAVNDARHNIGMNRISRCRFLEWNGVDGLPRKIMSGSRPDVVLIDPPRTGLPEKLSADLGRLAASRILYLSCDPPTLARDLGRLTRSGYKVRRIQPIELFPQTYHMETLVELVYNKSLPMGKPDRSNQSNIVRKSTTFSAKKSGSAARTATGSPNP